MFRAVQRLAAPSSAHLGRLCLPVRMVRTVRGPSKKKAVDEENAVVLDVLEPVAEPKGRVVEDIEDQFEVSEPRSAAGPSVPSAGWSWVPPSHRTAQSKVIDKNQLAIKRK